MPNWADLPDRLRALGDAIAHRCGDSFVLQVESPVTRQSLRRRERKWGCRYPPPLDEIYALFGRVQMRWVLTAEALKTIPRALRQEWEPKYRRIGGHMVLDYRQRPLEVTLADERRSLFPITVDTHLDLDRSEVVYWRVYTVDPVLRIADSVGAFLDTWIGLGSLNTKLLLPLLGPNGLDPTSKIAQAWRRWLGVVPA